MKSLVLLIEDNETNRYLANFLLEQAGLEVLHAKTGKEGLALIAKQKPALIILDIQLPEMDGYEVAALVKNDPTYASIPILVVTSYAMIGDRKRALELGVNDYLEKPYDPEEFIRRVQALLSTPVSP